MPSLSKPPRWVAYATAMPRKQRDPDADQGVVVVPVSSRVKHHTCQVGKRSTNAKPASETMPTWGKADLDSTAIEVRAIEIVARSSAHSRLEITKQDRDRRKHYVDDVVRMLVESGMSATKAKQKATERYDAEHPWFKQTTRGKV